MQHRDLLFHVGELIQKFVDAMCFALNIPNDFCQLGFTDSLQLMTKFSTGTSQPRDIGLLLVNVSVDPFESRISLADQLLEFLLFNIELCNPGFEVLLETS